MPKRIRQGEIRIGFPSQLIDKMNPESTPTREVELGEAREQGRKRSSTSARISIR